jgi:hypothetical protein
MWWQAFCTAVDHEVLYSLYSVMGETRQDFGWLGQNFYEACVCFVLDGCFGVI